MQEFAPCKATAMGRALPKLTSSDLFKDIVSLNVGRIMRLIHLWWKDPIAPKYKFIILAMKLTGIILLAACLHVSAKGVTQTVNLSEKDAPFYNVIKAIEQQTEFVFFYKTTWLEQARKVTIKAENMPLQQALDLCFKDQPFSYTISGKNITIIPKKNNEGFEEEFPPIDIHGKVVDENGKPVPGVTVTIKGTKKHTLTNENGEFSISDVADDAVLLFSSVNMEPFAINVSGQKEILAKLKTKTSELDEVQVIAYGQTTRRFQTGNISSVKGEDIHKQSVNNPLLALQGRVPGLFITQASGLPGTNVAVQIEGRNSIASGNNPLYIIDGVPYSAQMLPTVYAPELGGSGAGSPLSFINPADIESIEILKDADATAIYGSRAANGAILITTTKGKSGKPRLVLNGQTGWGKVTRKLNLLSTQDYLEMRHEARRNDGINAAPSASDYDINGVWDTTRNTDWQKELIGHTAHFTDIQGSVSGGNNSIQYLLGTGFHRETTVFPGSNRDKKGSIHFNINGISPNQKLKMQFSGNYLVDNNRLPSTDLTNQAIILPPNAPALYTVDGDLNWMPNSSGASTWRNPLSFLNQIHESKTTNLVSNLTIAYTILPHLEIKSSFGYTSLRTEDYLGYPMTAVKPESRATYSRFATYTNNLTNSWIIEPQANYKTKLGKLKLDVLIGGTIQQNNSNGVVLGGTGYSNDGSLKDIRSASTVAVSSSTLATYKYVAAFGRTTWNWADKYIVNLTARRDGSSRFGSKNQFQNFASIGTSWIFSEEIFFKKNISFISFGKLRASFGTTGNDQIGDYRFMDLYSPYTENVGVPYQGMNSLIINELPNPYLQWEETKKLLLGIDLGLLKDKLIIAVNYVHNTSSNQLLSYGLPTITGFGAITENFPATIRNTSWEFAINSTNYKRKNFSWTTNFNLSIPKNELIKFPNLSTSAYASTFSVGQPITIQKVFHSIGVDPATGIYKFVDKEGNLTSNPNYSLDRTASVNTAPKLFGGMENSFKYKGFRLDVLLQFVKQIGPNYYFGYSRPPGFSGFNQPSSVLNRWQKTGDIAAIQKFSSGFSIYVPHYFTSFFSDVSFSDASFIRLKNLSLSYQFDEILTRKVHTESLRVYIQGQNLLTKTNFKGMDPENQSTNSLPPLKVLTIGLQIGL